MANAFIAEYKEMVKDESGDNVAVPAEPRIAQQTVSFTTTNASLKFNDETKFIRVIVDAKAHYHVSASPVATTSQPYMPADLPEYFGVRKNMKIAFVTG